MSSSDKTMEDMTPEERLRSLQQFAESKEFVSPGDAGILAVNANYSAFGYGSSEPDGDSPLPPPSHDTYMGKQPEVKKGPVTRWLEKRQEKKEVKEGKVVVHRVVALLVS